MLTPKQLNDLPEELVELFAQLEQDILAYMARRISAQDLWIPSTDWQRLKLVEMGRANEWIVKELARYTHRTEREIIRLMEDAGVKALRTDDAIYRRAGLDPPPISRSPALDDVLQEGIRKTAGLFANLTRTTAQTATGQFERALDRAYMQVTSGGYDTNKAIQEAVKSLSSEGLEAVRYPSGHVDHMDVAVRRATVTGVNQTALGLQSARADEMGCELVEVSAHGGARPSHAKWQGKIYCRKGRHPEYPDFVSSTGYGTGEGLGGWNCRHSFYPYFEGAEPSRTRAELQQMEGQRVTYNGKELSVYEAQQTQRYIERQIRRWKREKAAMTAAGQPPDEAAAKLAQWQMEQRAFIQQTGFKRQYDREK